MTRRPWMFVMGEVLRHLDAGPTKQAGLAAALPGIVAPLRARRRIANRLEVQLMHLQAAEQGLS